MSFVIWLVFLIAFFYAFYKVIIFPRISPLRKIPGPKRTSFFMGNYYEVQKAEPAECHIRWAREYGPVVRYHFFFNSPTVLISGEQELKHVLVTNASNYHKFIRTNYVFDRIFGEGLLLLEDDIHRAHRKMIQPSFNYSKVNEMIPIFEGKAKRLISIWEGIQERTKSLEIEITRQMSNLTLDIIGLAAFGYDFHAIDDLEGKSNNFYRTIMTSFGLSIFNLIPWWRNIPTSANIELRKALRKLESVFENILVQKKSKLDKKQGENGPIDLLDLLLECRNDEKNTILTDHQLSAHALTFILAGHETTSVCMSWLFYALTKYPEIDKRIYEELSRVLGGKEHISFEDAEELHFLQNVIKETLRMYPPVTITPRVTLKDDIIGGYHIPAGTRIVISPAVQHKLEQYWENPEKFDPDRWNKENEHNQYGFIPFLG